jgi:hypothetical protein
MRQVVGGIGASFDTPQHDTQIAQARPRGAYRLSQPPPCGLIAMMGYMAEIDHKDVAHVACE